MRRLPALLAALPPLAVAIAIALIGVDVPIMDQWELVPYLARSRAGTDTFAQLFMQHNEHRLFFPRLIMIGLARLSGWDVRWEMALDLLLALALFAMLVWGLRLRGWLVPLLSLLVFSLGQKENWFWGWQIQIFLSVLAAAASLCLLARPPTLARTLAAAALGLLAFGCFADGGLVFVVGCALLAFERAPRRHLAIFALVGVGAFALYLHGYARPPNHPPLTLALTHPLLTIGYTLAYLGAPLGSLNQFFSIAVGAAALALLVFGARAIVRAERSAPAELLAALGLAAYALGSAAITALGRAPFGLMQALSSRYQTIAELLFVALLAVVAGWPALAPRRRHALAGLFVALTLAVSVKGAQYATADAQVRRAARSALLAGDSAHEGALYPNLEILRARRAMLVTLRLSVFRRSPPDRW